MHSVHGNANSITKTTNLVYKLALVPPNCHRGRNLEPLMTLYGVFMFDISLSHLLILAVISRHIERQLRRFDSQKNLRIHDCTSLMHLCHTHLIGPSWYNAGNAKKRRQQTANERLNQELTSSYCEFYSREAVSTTLPSTFSRNSPISSSAIRVSLYHNNVAPRTQSVHDNRVLTVDVNECTYSPQSNMLNRFIMNTSIGNL